MHVHHSGLLNSLLIGISGDYQFDIYRLMRKHNGGCWADFRPLSNVMVRPSPFMRLMCSIARPISVVVALPSHQAAEFQELTPTEEDEFSNQFGVHGTTML